MGAGGGVPGLVAVGVGVEVAVGVGVAVGVCMGVVRYQFSRGSPKHSPTVTAILSTSQPGEIHIIS